MEICRLGHEGGRGRGWISNTNTGGWETPGKFGILGIFGIEMGEGGGNGKDGGFELWAILI